MISYPIPEADIHRADFIHTVMQDGHRECSVLVAYESVWCFAYLGGKKLPHPVFRQVIHDSSAYFIVRMDIENDEVRWYFGDEHVTTTPLPTRPFGIAYCTPFSHSRVTMKPSFPRKSKD